MKASSSRSVFRRAAQPRTFSSQPKRDSLEESSSTANESSGSTFYDSVVTPISPERKHRSIQNDPARGKKRKTKMQKIQELLDENKQLKDAAWELRQELIAKELQLKKLDGRQSQFISGEGTKEEKPEEKQMEALRALTAVTKTQQESLAAQHERYEELSRVFEENEQQIRRLQKDLSKKKKEVIMLESEIDSNLLEITGLRKELAHARQKGESAETDLRSDRRKILELTRALALTKAGQSDASDDMKLIASKIIVFDEEIKEKEAEVESQRIELEKQVERIQQLRAELEHTQDQVEEYEKERDATVADMETYYEALKYELEEKSRLLEVAEKEKTEFDAETAEALRSLEQRCDQLNTELLDAQDEISLLRRENDVSSFASAKSDAIQQEFEEERERLNSTLKTMKAELKTLKKRHGEMQLEHIKAYQALEEENGNLKSQLTEFRAALQEANVRNRAMGEENELQRVQNESLMEISRDLHLKLREAQANKEQVSTIAEDTTIPKTDQAQESQSDADIVGGGHDQSRGHESVLVDPGSPVALEPVQEDSKDSSSDVDAENDNGGSNSTFFGDEAVVDPQASPISTEGDLPQQALPLAAIQSSPDSSEHEDMPTGPIGPTGQQALLLAAAAGLKLQKAQSEKSNSTWRSMNLMKRGQNRSSSPLPPLTGNNISSSNSLGVDNQIEKLERENQEQKESIKKLKSELVRLNAFYRDAAYISKRKVESLTQENAAYEIKVAVLEKMLEKLGGPTESHLHRLEVSDSENAPETKETTDDGNSVQSGVQSQVEVTPQRDWSSPPKFLDRIKDLEALVRSLEMEKSDAEAKAKALESDLERYQRTSKKAALDSLFEIERLKRENAEKERRLLALQNEEVEADANANAASADTDMLSFTYTEDLDREAVGENDE